MTKFIGGDSEGCYDTEDLGSGMGLADAGGWAAIGKGRHKGRALHRDPHQKPGRHSKTTKQGKKK
jgi:hypothetical protein